MNPRCGPLAGLRIVSLALNLPGPAALMRCRELGAECRKIEPPSGDPMARYEPLAYEALHAGIAVERLDLKQPEGRSALDRHLEPADVLLTSFRSSALRRLGLDAASLEARHPHLHVVSIVGAPGEAADIPGHDLTYQAEQDLVPGVDVPPSLFADMGGALLAVQAVLVAALDKARPDAGGRGRWHEVALVDAARFLALPRRWTLTQSCGTVGGAHAGYRVYRCRDGRVAVAALEPHFAGALARAAGLDASADMFAPATHEAIAGYLRERTRDELDRLASEQDVPLHTLPP